jgi:hypothetical protein
MYRHFIVAISLLLALGCRAATNSFFAIRVVDDQTGRGVPLAELKTQNSAAWWTDSAGVVAFDEPGLMGQEVFFHLSSPGYDYPKDFFNNRGVKLRATPGGTAQVKLKRLNIAERLYRVTGAGIYRDSVLAGLPVPLKQPLLNAQVLGARHSHRHTVSRKDLLVLGRYRPRQLSIGEFRRFGSDFRVAGSRRTRSRRWD